MPVIAYVLPILYDVHFFILICNEIIKNDKQKQIMLSLGDNLKLTTVFIERGAHSQIESATPLLQQLIVVYN